MLERGQITRLQEITTEAELFKDREALLLDVPSTIKARIDTQASPGEQILADLLLLNDLAKAGDVPPLNAWLRNARRQVTNPGHEKYLDGLLGDAAPAPTLDWTGVLCVARQPEFEQAAAHVRAGNSVALLAPRGMGGASLVVALKAYLKTHHPTWTVVLIEATPGKGETEADYQARMETRLKRATSQAAERSVAIVHTWSDREEHREHQAALGKHLRRRLEEPGGFTMLAVGGFVLYTLALGNHKHSVLNDAKHIWVDDLKAEALQRVLAHLGWSAADHLVIEEAGGGHDGVLRALIEARMQRPDWPAVEAAVWEKDLHYIEALTRLTRDELVDALEALIETADGLRMRWLRPLSAPFEVFFQGIGRRRGPRTRSYLVPRCAAEIAVLRHSL